MDKKKYSSKFIHYYGLKVPELLRYALSISNVHFLCELGVGDGALLEALNREKLLYARYIYGVDISKERLERAKDILPMVEFLHKDLRHTGLMGIDFVICNQVIEHIENRERVISSIYDMLGSNGVCYLSTVFKKPWAWYFYRNKGKWVLDPTHVIEYTHESQLIDDIKKYFEILINKKELQWFPVTDFILKRLGFGNDCYNNPIFRALRKIRIPILGYYEWILVLRKA
jgi:2-polyprenyl-3-methyl-5-hydroxy-6-metoxy-1,4-benzoquinol methylase